MTVEARTRVDPARLVTMERAAAKLISDLETKAHCTPDTASLLSRMPQPAVAE